MASMIAFRPYLKTDARMLGALFRASVETLGEDDYNADQLEAWAAQSDDAEAFGRRLEAMLTILAMLDGEVAGFASLKDNSSFEMLYVDPRFARRGVGGALADAIEKLAGGRGAATLTVNASDCAKQFFERRGYVAQRRNMRPLGDEWLGDTTMTRDLTPAAATVLQ